MLSFRLSFLFNKFYIIYIYLLHVWSMHLFGRKEIVEFKVRAENIFVIGKVQRFEWGFVKSLQTICIITSNT